jgi:hypothetical protein
MMELVLGERAAKRDEFTNDPIEIADMEFTCTKYPG